MNIDSIPLAPMKKLIVKDHSSTHIHASSDKRQEKVQICDYGCKQTV